MQKIILMALLMFSVNAYATTYWGQQGHQGRDGYSGRDGYDGQSTEHFTDGSPQFISVPGQDGTDGSNGGDGYQASCGGQPTPADNVIGAAGGDGGDGGQGGRGGNGGDVRIYYDTAEALKQVRINTTPGRAGRGGYGGHGGRSCNCQVPSWQVDGQTYTCRSNNSRNGMNRGNGSAGSYGQLVLVPALERVTPDEPSVRLVMSDMLQGEFYPQKNIWEQRRGARNLLAAGSAVADSYWFYKGKVGRHVTFAWNAPRAITDFAKRNMTLNLTSANAVAMSLPDDVWADYETTLTEPDQMLVTFKSAAYTQELFDLEISEITGNGATLEAVVTDKRALPVEYGVKTSFKIQYFTRNAAVYYQRYNGAVAPELVTVDGDKFRIQLGKLKIDPKYLAPEQRLRLRVYTTRQLGKRSAYTTNQRDHTIAN